MAEAKKTVNFYAPLQAGVEYRQAAEVSDYHAEFYRRMTERRITSVFSCNCILNYLYANLAGNKPLAIAGPATFGEVGYVLLNQALVYLELRH